MQMEQLYQEIILDHYRAPHHHGLRDPFDAQVHHVNPTCGDEVTLRVQAVRSRRRSRSSQDISYDALGCSISPGVHLGAHRPGHRSSRCRRR